MDGYNVLVNKAKEFAKLKHKGQYYGDKDYYEKHIVGVVGHIQRGVQKEHQGSVFYEQIITVAYLHDTLEDTDTTVEELENMFGANISYVVEILTRKDEEVYSDYIDRVM